MRQNENERAGVAGIPRHRLFGLRAVPCAADTILGGRCQNDAVAIVVHFDDEMHGPGGPATIPACAACAGDAHLLPVEPTRYVAMVRRTPWHDAALDAADVAAAERYARHARTGAD